MTTSEFPPEYRQTLCDTPVTLNGYRAMVTGTRRDFPKIVALTGPFRGASFEWSWAAVERIIAHRNGAFQTQAN